jgi:magnesium chelatase family protein
VEDLLRHEPGESTAVVAARVARARSVAMARQGCLNNRLAGGQLDEFAPIDDVGRAVLRHELEHQRLSARGYHRIRRVARSIVDLRLDPTDQIDEEAIHLALGLRSSVTRALRAGRAA